GSGLKQSQTGGSFTFGSLGFNGSLLLNYTPSNPNVDMTLDPQLATALPSGMTLALGSSNYLGNITVATAANPITVQNVVNFAFVTKGAVSGAEFLKTNGRVLVLSGVAGGGAAQDQANQSINNVNGLDQLTPDYGQVEDPASAAGALQNPPIEFNNQPGDSQTFECT
ncbi:MAG TPA: hypothetical protein VHE37_00300, partial [Nevskiaceae bacterium]|nr:hypothetical protein [Nevskiaceae bacterium]